MSGSLGLPDGITALLFDLDGVLTDTAAVHNAAWKEMFDAFLKPRAEKNGDEFVPFDSDKDYGEYVDGKPRADGVRDFLASRDIDLPEGDPDDGPDEETVNGLGNRKNEALLEHIDEDGVKVFEGSRRYLEAARDAGYRRAVVSSSANTAAGARGDRAGRVHRGAGRRQHAQAGEPQGQAGAGHVPARREAARRRRRRRRSCSRTRSPASRPAATASSATSSASTGSARPTR